MHYYSHKFEKAKENEGFLWKYNYKNWYRMSFKSFFKGQKHGRDLKGIMSRSKMVFTGESYETVNQ